MKPELEAALVPIGWKRVKTCFPLRAGILEHKLTHYAGRLSVDRCEAKQEAVRFEEIRRSIEYLHRELGQLHPYIRATINIVSTPVDKRDDGITDNVGSTLQALANIWEGVEEVELRLAYEAKGLTRGGSRNEAVYEIAKVVAEIFVRGAPSSVSPKFGNRADGEGESGPYVKAVREVAEILGHKRRTFRGPCEEAIAELTEAKVAELRVTEFEKFRRGWRPSLASFE